MKINTKFNIGDVVYCMCKEDSLIHKSRIHEVIMEKGADKKTTIKYSVYMWYSDHDGMAGHFSCIEEDNIFSSLDAIADFYTSGKKEFYYKSDNTFESIFDAGDFVYFIEKGGVYQKNIEFVRIKSRDKNMFNGGISVFYVFYYPESKRYIEKEEKDVYGSIDSIVSFLKSNVVDDAEQRKSYSCY